MKRLFLLWALLLAGGALLIGCCSPAARAQSNAPTANAEMVHSPISLYYNRPGKYQNDASAWWFRLRYHMETRVVTPTQDGWAFNGVTLSWTGTRAFFPLTAMIPFTKSDAWGSTAGWNTKSTYSQPPGLWSITDAFRDAGCCFVWNNNPAAPATAPWMISSTATFTFNFTRSHLVQQPNGTYLLKSDPFTVVVPVVVGDSTAPIGTASTAAPAKRGPRQARGSLPLPPGATRVASASRFVPLRRGAASAAREDTLDPATKSTTYTQTFIDQKLSTTVLSGVNNQMNTYFTANPNCYHQDGTQQPVNIAWPENLEF
jgi:hypothetical protein